MKCTKELLQGRGVENINPCQHRCFTLRGCNIDAVENFGVLKYEAYESIDLSDNSILKLDGFPPMANLKQLILTNNKICRIDEGVGDMFPNIVSIVLANNFLESLDHLSPLYKCTKLQRIVLKGNPVDPDPNLVKTLKENLPSLKFVDCIKV